MCEDKLAHLREFVCIKLYRKYNYYVLSGLADY